MPKLAEKKRAGKSKHKPRRTSREHLLPYPEFPLFPQGSGRWAKKIRGKLHYFGRWDGADGDTKWNDALQDYKAKVDDLKAGRTPRVAAGALSVDELVNRFLTSKKHLVDTRELTPRSFADYYGTCERVVRVFGRKRLVIDLATDDFDQLRKDIASTRGPVALGNEVQRARVLFKYGFDAGLIDRPIRYGPNFKRPSKKVLRQERHAKGERMFESAELRRIIEAAGVPLKAMILLGLNCGFGNNDVGTLPIASVDLDGGWIRFPRPKTAVQRRCPLWPETIEAIRNALADRPRPKNRDDDGLLFITKYGQAWAKGREIAVEQDGETFSIKNNRANPVSHETRKLLVSLKLHRPGLSFYTFRHVLETIGGDAKDQVAVNSIMGHVDDSMAAEYRERISDERLKAVTDHVRAWLFTDKTSPKSAKANRRRSTVK